MVQKKCWIMLAVSGVLLALILSCFAFFVLTLSRGYASPQCAEDLGLVFTEDEDELEVLAVRDRSSANQSGIQPGDRILSADQIQLSSVEQLDSVILSQISTGNDSLRLRVMRDAQAEDAILPLNGCAFSF